MNISPFFTFTRSEKRGILVLIFVILILIAGRIYIPLFLKKSNVTKYELAYLKEKEIQSNANEKKIKFKTTDGPEHKKQQQIIKAIDPNSAAYNELMNLGFSPFISSNIIKYRNNGGRFSELSDLYKIYGIDSSYYELINRYILIVKDSQAIEKTKIQDKISININEAGVEEMQNLSGIGPVLGKRIVKYRELLGGYVNISQINEVYGISDSIYFKIEPFLYLEPENYQPIDLNQLSVKELYKHPYISKYQAHAIVEYREVSGKFSSLDEIILNNIMDSQSFKKIEPYLTIK
jgi:competence ComEA-like helix-hairpin-helix protein